MIQPTKRLAFISSFALLTCAACLITGALAADPAKMLWPQYRGPDRSGISSETGLLKVWPAEGPKVLWKVPLGDGYSGISVAGDRLYTMHSQGGDDVIACFNARDGKEVWRTRVEARWTDEMGDGPRSTPTVDGGVVYAVSSRGLLVAVAADTGQKVWEKNLQDVFGAQVPHWGVSTSPLVEGDLVVVDAGGAPGKSLVALDKKTGATRWTSYTDRPGYSAPLAVDMLGVRQILSFAGSSLVSVAAGDGKVLWSVPWKTSYDVNAAMPVFLPPNRVFISSSYDTGGAVYEIKKTGDAYKTSEVWKNRTMKNHFNSSVHAAGYLYGFDDATLKCVDAATGEEKWRQRGFAKGSLLMADGQLIVFSENGLLALVEATPEAYKEKARAQILEGRTWTMPSLADRKLFLRNQKLMVALDLAG
ncbi:MAG TPA: PQQ-binding-like beta-propeller repeat protein [Candidatus Polarisedimenticolia bacterium]|nr:PQQ-binding-like beta-propeller repeat protein [Candidatus Polarisedimenticolia bacterium]